MTTHRFHRCIHCKDVYPYQGSGWSPHEEEAVNDPEYCPRCKGAINLALEEIPKRVEEFWAPYDKITMGELKEKLEEQEKEFASVLNDGFLPKMRQYWPSLIDMDDLENKHINGLIDINGDTIRYSYWTKRDDENISIKMERNLETGEEHPWINYER